MSALNDIGSCEQVEKMAVSKDPDGPGGRVAGVPGSGGGVG